MHHHKALLLGLAVGLLLAGTLKSMPGFSTINGYANTYG